MIFDSPLTGAAIGEPRLVVSPIARFEFTDDSARAPPIVNASDPTAHRPPRRSSRD